MRPAEAPAPEASAEGLGGCLKIGLASLVLLAGLAAGAVAVCRELFASPCRGSNMSCAVGSLRMMGTAQSIFHESDRDRDGVLDFGDLTELGQANLVDTVLSAGVKAGYRFTVEVGTPDGRDRGRIWWAAADPAIPGRSGDVYFFTNQGGRIYYSERGPIRPERGSLVNRPDRGRPLEER